MPFLVWSWVFFHTLLTTAHYVAIMLCALSVYDTSFWKSVIEETLLTEFYFMGPLGPPPIYIFFLCPVTIPDTQTVVF